MLHLFIAAMVCIIVVAGIYQLSVKKNQDPGAETEKVSETEETTELMTEPDVLLPETETEPETEIEATQRNCLWRMIWSQMMTLSREIPEQIRITRGSTD